MWQVKAHPDTKWYVVCFSTQHLINQIGKENITQEKWDAFKAQATALGITVKATDNAVQFLDDSGLEPEQQDPTP